MPTDVTKGVNADGNDVTGLTVPIVKEGMAKADARNNPRVKKEDLIKFIKEDLEYAEQNIGKLTKTEKTLPHLDCVYGLEARLYMWEGDYAKAQAAAKNAIKTSSVQPMTQAQCLNTTTGFNNLADFDVGLSADIRGCCGLLQVSSTGYHLCVTSRPRLLRCRYW